MGLVGLVREQVEGEWEWRVEKYLEDLEREICLHGR